MFVSIFCIIFFLHDLQSISIINTVFSSIAILIFDYWLTFPQHFIIAVRTWIGSTYSSGVITEGLLEQYL